MAINCPKCNAENGDDARFCAQCGAPLAGDAAPAAPPSRAAAAPPATNWWAIIGILAIIAVLVWLFATPKKDNQMAGAGNGTANPHASGGAASDDNPHGMGSQAGMPDIDAMKAKLDANPLDVASLSDLYQTYGMIGRGPKVREYLDAAMKALLEQRDTLGEDWTNTGRQLAVAALLGGDPEGALAALNQLREEVPGDRDTMLLLAQVHYSIDQPAEAVELYDEYLSGSDPEADGATYWQARLHRAMMNLRLFEQSPEDARDTAALAAATGELEEVTASQGDNFDAWLQLGNAYGSGGDVPRAETAYNKALELASDEQQKWEAEAALAVMHGEEPPEQPAPAMGGMGSPANPHGGMGSMGNPHGGGGDDPGNTT
jgi:tetratricopeptide (TPR) repeat protein